MELMVCSGLVGGTTEQSCLFLDLTWSYQWDETLTNFLHHTSAVPQPFLLLMAANLAIAGYLSWKRSLWSVPTWMTIQQRKSVFFLTLYEIINDMKYYLNCLHDTSAVLQPFLLLIAANLALAGCFGWKWSLWPVPAWFAVKWSKAVFLMTLYDSMNYMNYLQTVCITPQPCHSHFCCWLLPIWP